MFIFRYLRFSSIILSLLIVTGCDLSVKQQEKLTEVEQLYNQEQYQNAMNVARFNLSKNPQDLASIVTVWKIQVLQGTKSTEYVQQFYSQARERVLDYGEKLIPYLGRALAEDPYNTVRLFALYCLSEFEDTLSSRYLAKVLEPDYELGRKPSNVTLDLLRTEAAMILGKRKYTPAFDGIVALTKNPDGEVRATAAMALGFLGDERALPVLEELRKDNYTVGGSRWVAEMADSAIARIKRGQK